MTPLASEVGRKVRTPPMRTSVIHRRTAILFSCAVLAVVLPGGGRANNRPPGTPPATGRCTATTGGDRILAAHPDHPANVAAHPGVDLPPAGRCAAGRRHEAARRRQLSSDAHRRQRRHVSAGGESSRGDRAGNRQGDLARPVTGGAPSRRGVAYWPGDADTPPRIIFTAGRRLIALNASDRRDRSGFGTAGEVDSVVPYNSVPLVYDNIVVVGANTPPGPWRLGNPRAFDARTGAKLWEFSAVPQPGESGHDTWEGDSWKVASGVNAWPFYFTLDEQRGLLYVPLASPIGGAYGGDRKGANLFGNSVVALDIQTGKYKWHFQTIHHDLWDADPPAPPALFDIMQNGRTVPALGADDQVRLPVHPESRNRRSRSSASKSGRCQRATSPASWHFPRSRFR